MDILNDYIHKHPHNDDLSDSEISENEEHVKKLVKINENRPRHKRKHYSFDDWCTIYSDDLWYLWGIIAEFKKGSGVLDNLDYPGFCDMCYQNSSKI
jgi:hypothetical protein